MGAWVCPCASRSSRRFNRCTSKKLMSVSGKKSSFNTSFGFCLIYAWINARHSANVHGFSFWLIQQLTNKIFKSFPLFSISAERNFRIPVLPRKINAITQKATANLFLYKSIFICADKWDYLPAYIHTHISRRNSSPAFL